MQIQNETKTNIISHKLSLAAGKMIPAKLLVAAEAWEQSSAITEWGFNML